MSLMVTFFLFVLSYFFNTCLSSSTNIGEEPNAKINSVLHIVMQVLFLTGNHSSHKNCRNIYFFYFLNVAQSIWLPDFHFRTKNVFLAFFRQPEFICNVTSTNACL